MADKNHYFATHGMSDTAVYTIWNSMIQRCYSDKQVSYPNYGGRGITVCDRWLKFENFFEDMGHVPKGMSIEREDTNGNYEPDNCKWLLRSLQNRNRRDTKYLTVKGVTKSLADWAEEKGIKPSTLRQRVYVYLWDDEKAVLT